MKNTTAKFIFIWHYRELQNRDILEFDGKIYEVIEQSYHTVPNKFPLPYYTYIKEIK